MDSSTMEQFSRLINAMMEENKSAREEIREENRLAREENRLARKESREEAIEREVRIFLT